MKYRVKVPELGDRELTVQRSEWTGRTTVFVDGRELSKQKQGGHYEVEAQDGSIHKIRIKGAGFAGVPKVYVDEKQIEIARKLSAAENIAAAIPLLLVFFGGAIGGVFGALATVLNMRVLRSNRSVWIKVLMVITSTIVATVLYMIFAFLFLMLIGA